jgi:hypothetical protein
MDTTDSTPSCPHCGRDLQAFELPDNTGWQTGFQLACFNDDCPYYRRGWVHMKDRYAVAASYRYRVDPETGAASPLAVWSSDALKDRILDADVTREADRSESDPNDEKGASE